MLCDAVVSKFRKWHSRGQRFDPAILHHKKGRPNGCPFLWWRIGAWENRPVRSAAAATAAKPPSAAQRRRVRSAQVRTSPLGCCFLVPLTPIADRPRRRRRSRLVPRSGVSSLRTAYRSRRRFLFQSKRPLSLTPSQLLPKSDPLRWAPILFFRIRKQLRPPKGIYSPEQHPPGCCFLAPLTPMENRPRRRRRFFVGFAAIPFDNDAAYCIIIEKAHTPLLHRRYL